MINAFKQLKGAVLQLKMPVHHGGHNTCQIGWEMRSLKQGFSSFKEDINLLNQKGLLKSKPDDDTIVKLLISNSRVVLKESHYYEQGGSTGLSLFFHYLSSQGQFIVSGREGGVSNGRWWKTFGKIEFSDSTIQARMGHKSSSCSSDNKDFSYAPQSLRVSLPLQAIECYFDPNVGTLDSFSLVLKPAVQKYINQGYFHSNKSFINLKFHKFWMI